MRADHPLRLAPDLMALFSRIVRRVRSESSDEITQNQYAVLVLLERAPTTARRLAARERVSPPAMTRTLTAMEEGGLVLRRPDPDDGRQTIVEPTPAGLAALRRVRGDRDAWLAARLGALTEKERAVLAEAAGILRRIESS